LQIKAFFRIYAIIFGLTRFGIDDPWPHLSCVGEWKEVTSLSRCQPRVWITLVI